MSKNALADLVNGKQSAKEKLIEMHIHNYWREIEKEFDLTKTEWGVSEWKAVAMVVVREKMELGLSLEVATDVGRESLAEMKRLRKSFHSGGTHKKGNEYEPKASIRRVTSIIGKRSRDAVLKHLNKSENCDAIYMAGGVMFDGIDREKGILFYYDSNINPDIKQELKFKRLSNILTEIKE